MTIKQRDFIVSLVNERELPADNPKSTYLRNLVAGTAGEPNPAQASRMIEWLLALPRKSSPVTPEAHDVPAGRFALVHPERSIVEFFIVDKPEDGKWAGRTFVKQQASDDKYPVRGARRDEVLARIAEDPHGAMIRYGHELGRCGRCGRTLTDEVSRAMGIGPDCAALLGIERMSEEEAVSTTPPATQSVTEAWGGMPSPQREGLEDVLGTPEPRKSDGRDKQNVSYEVGDWRARKRFARQMRDEDGPTRERRPSSQMVSFPGESWEDIFREGA